MADQIRRNRWVIVLCGGLLLFAIQGCGGEGTEEGPASASVAPSTAAPATTSTAVAPTTAPSTTTATTTTSTTTTTTTVPPTPAELRAGFLDSLEAAGWMTYVAEQGWSIMHPGDWTVDDDGGFLLITPSDVLGALSVAPALDAAPTDLGSEDYLLGGVEVSVAQGQLRPADPAATVWFDVNFDGFEGHRDVFGISLSWSTDPFSGDPIPEDANAPTWWYGYYDPSVEPNPGYVFLTFGADPLLFEEVNTVVASFTPAAQYPGAEAPTCDVVDSLARHLVQYGAGMQLIIDGDLARGADTLQPVISAFEADLARAESIPGAPSALEPVAAVLPDMIGNYLTGTILVAEGAVEGDFDKIQVGEQIHAEGSATLTLLGPQIAETC